MNKKKKLILNCSLGFAILMFFASVAIVLIADWYETETWRINGFRYADDGSHGWDMGWLHKEGYLLLNGDVSYSLVYSWHESSLTENKEVIGFVRNLPIVNPHRPDRNFLERGRVYQIEGLCSQEWIYVIYEEIVNATPLGTHHRIYKSTSLEIDNPLELLLNHIEGLKQE